MSQPVIEPPAATAAEHAEQMRAYCADGERRARAFGHRGPIRFGANGQLDPKILDAYWQHGFYVFENVVGAGEVEALRAGIHDMIERAPVRPGAKTDSRGRPALGLGYARKPHTLARPLTDPWGGTTLLGGRHPHRMEEPAAAADAPEYVVYLMHGMCQFAEAGLRLYGHPHLLAVAASVNGEDFVPFNDAIFVKQPGLGGAVAWHQDGVTHWDSPDWDQGSHGFNFQVQLYPTTSANCLWVVPGTHKLGRIDIKARIAANGGSERLPDALPLLCRPGDVTMVNRQMLHGSFANTSPDLRVSITFGFHRRRSVLGAKAALSMESETIYDEQRIRERSAVVQVAIDARARAFPGETPFRYLPFEGHEDELRYGPDTFEHVIRDYNTRDLAI